MPKGKQITNPFYERVERGGIRFVNERPTVRGRPPTNPYRERLAGGVRLRPGRPRSGEDSGATVVKSVRLPPAIWARAEAQAAREGISLHAALRQAVLIWLRS